MSSLKDQLAGLKPGIAEAQPQPDAALPIKRPASSAPRPAPSASYAALQPTAKVHLIGFPLRLSTEAVDRLNEWKRLRGITPGLLVREIVEKGILELQERFEKESRS